MLGFWRPCVFLRLFVRCYIVEAGRELVNSRYTIRKFQITETQDESYDVLVEAYIRNII